MGILEGSRAYKGRVFKLVEHLRRLYDSARALMLEVPLTHAEMHEAVLETVRANELRDAYIRVVVTRGPGDLGLDPRKCTEPTVFIIADAIALYPEELYQKGLALITCTTRRNAPVALDSGIKTLDYLNNIPDQI